MGDDYDLAAISALELTNYRVFLARRLQSASVTPRLRQLKAVRLYARRAIIAPAGYAKGEAMAVQWDDIDWEAGTITMRASLTGGG